MKPALIASLLFISSFAAIAQEPKLEVPKDCKANYFLTSDSVRLHYLVAGKGTALILIPGWTMPATIWEKQIEHFSKTNLVIAIDPRSQGKSQQTTEGLHFEREAKDIKELTDHLHLNAFYLAGWSWGGPTLYTYLREHNTPSLKGVIIVDAPVKLNESFMRVVTALTKGVLHDRKNFVNVFIKGLFAQPQPDNYLKKLANASLITSTTAAITLLAVFFVYDDAVWIQTLKSTKTPVLFIGADGTEEKYRELQKEFTVNYTIIPGAGHTVFVDKPAEFNKVVQQFMQ